MKQDREVAHFLRDFVGEYGKRRDDAELRVRHERCRHEHAIQQVVERVAGENQVGRRPVARVVARRVHLAGVVVAVTPEHEFLEQEKQQDTDQQREADPMSRAGTGTVERMWNQSEERRAEQRAGRKADEVRQHGRAPARIERQEHAGREGAQHAAQRREHDDQGQATQGSFCCVRGWEYRSG